MALPELMTVTSVAKQLGITRNTIYNWLDQGLPYRQAVGNGHIWLVEEDVNAFLETRSSNDAAPRRKQQQEDHKRRSEEDWNEAYAEAQQTTRDQRYGSATSDGGIFGTMDRTPRSEVSGPVKQGGLVSEQNIGRGGVNGRFVNSQESAPLGASPLKQAMENR